MAAWQELEVEIADIARKEGHRLDTNHFGDTILLSREAINLTEFARVLAERVTVNSKTVKVKT